MFGQRYKQARACLDAMTPSMDWPMLLALAPPEGIKQPRFAAMCRQLQLYYTESLDEYPNEHTLSVMYGLHNKGADSES